MTGTLLGFVGVTIIAAAGARWLQRMQQVRVPRDKTAFLVANGLGAALGIVAFTLGTGLAGGIAAGVAVAGGMIFLALAASSRQAAVTPAVSVGSAILEMATSDDEGRPFALSSLRGTPFLLKFFRGHWCPFCVAELRRWGELTPALDAYGIRIVTICADTAKQIRKGRAKHGLRAVMLPDPDLAITDRYSLRNPRNFALKTGVIVPLPIPTTILVDAEGTVRWIDQSDDYQRRSDPERVLGAIRAVFGEPDRTAQGEPRAVPRSSGTAITTSGVPGDLTNPVRSR
jgi:peroxiredoxin